MTQAAAWEQNSLNKQTSSHVYLQQEGQSSKTKTREERKQKGEKGETRRDK